MYVFVCFPPTILPLIYLNISRNVCTGTKHNLTSHIVQKHTINTWLLSKEKSQKFTT